MQPSRIRKSPTHSNSPFRLTKSEADTFALMQKGITPDDICKALNITRGTLRVRARVIKEKMS